MHIYRKLKTKLAEREHPLKTAQASNMVSVVQSTSHRFKSYHGALVLK